MSTYQTVETPSRWAIVTALSPLVLWVALLVLAPDFTDPLYQNPPGLFGLPLGLVLVGLAGVLSVAGVVAVWRSTSSAARATAIGLLTIPSLLLIALGPLIVGALPDLSI